MCPGFDLNVDYINTGVYNAAKIGEGIEGLMEQVFCKLDFPCVFNDGSVVINGDCMSVLPHIKDRSVDLIFVDPPYNLGKDFGNGSDDWEDKSEYLSWCYGWIDECFRVLKDDGTIYVMNSTQNISYIDVYLREKYNVINNIVWYYDSSGVQSKYKYGSLYEPIIMANKSSKVKYTFNWKDVMVEARTGAVRKLIDYRKTPPQPYNNMKVPGNVWEFPRVRYRMGEYENHPSQKPEALLERIIKASSNPGEVVLDPFSGTFTTAVVAKKLGRKFIGIELSDSYYRIGLRRALGLSEYNGEKLVKNKLK